MGTPTGFGMKVPFQIDGAISSQRRIGPPPERSMANQEHPGSGSRRAIVILAAGRGTRMGPNADKALVDIAGIPMLEHVIRSCAEIPRRQLVVARNPDQDLVELPGHDYQVAIQDPGSRGTAAALIAAKDHLLPEIENVVVLFADNPLLSSASIASVLVAVDETARSSCDNHRIGSRSGITGSRCPPIRQGDRHPGSCCLQSRRNPNPGI